MVSIPWSTLPAKPSLFAETSVFDRHHPLHQPLHDPLPRFDRFEHYRCHQYRTFSRLRRGFLECLLYESYAGLNLQILVFDFFVDL